MRKFFLIAAVLFSASAAHAGANLAASEVNVQSATQATEQPSDAGDAEAKRRAMIDQRMAMQRQRQAAMQREMRRHPIRTRFRMALFALKRRFR